MEDTGAGMEAEALKQMFEPFVATREVPGGGGPGIAVVQGIVRGSGGHIDVQSVVGRGTTVCVLMARADPPERVASAPRSEPRPLKQGQQVLLCEDDAALRSSVTRMLEHLGQQVEAAADGVAAVELLRRRRGEFAVVLLDAHLPRRGSAETLVALRHLAPEAKVLLTSGHHEAEVEPGLRAGAHGFLAKPYGLRQLEAALVAVS